MKINVLTFGKEDRLSPVTKKDLELLSIAAVKQGHTLEIICAGNCQLKFDRKPEVFIKNQKVEKCEINIFKKEKNNIYIL